MAEVTMQTEIIPQPDSTKKDTETSFKTSFVFHTLNTLSIAYMQNYS